jgi:alcohol dehydrogenase (cytochrome c)
MRKLVITAGKMAIVEAVDAETGEFVFAKDLGLQTLVTAIDPKTGKKTFDPKLEPVPGKTYEFCPHGGGARSWPAASYDPNFKRLFIPLQMHCTEYTPVEPKAGDEFGGAGARWKILPPRDADGNFGRLDAVDVESQDWAWKYEARAPQSTASLPTAGGVVFEGQFDRYFTAHDSRNGKLLWKARLGDVPNSFPVTYEVDGRQYVAVMTGSGGPYTSTWQALIPDIRMPAQSGGALYVFALPE